MWKVGDKLRHRFNEGAGPGRVTTVEGRRITVHFPATGATLEFAATSDALVAFEMAAGTAARLDPDGEIVEIAGREGILYRLADGRLAADASLWPVGDLDGPVERLARGDVDTLEAFANRLEAMHLRTLREAGGLGSYLGGRIRIYPHQLYVAERACAADPVRWLLADEVGLGKTIEACLILSRLARERRAERILIVAPATLTVQWLGELYRKFHQVFVLLDEKRRRDVARELGEDFNPFEAHARAIVALEELTADPALTRLAVRAGLDLAIVDEAHRLERAAGHPGSPAYRAVAPLVQAARHALLLTATPLEGDAQGFFRLLQLLRPGALPEGTDFEARLIRGEPLPACTSATRRADIGGLQPRLPVPIEGPAGPDGDGTKGGGDREEAWASGWSALLALEERVQRAPAGTPPERRRRIERYRRALASPASLLPLLGADETMARKEVEEAEGLDPRARWLIARAPIWRRAGEKTLVFVAHRETLESLKHLIERATGQRIGIFHEELSDGRADIEVAQFRLPAGPAILVSTECGGEGRNFEFAKRLVLFDLPWNPGALEQRIGRLDRLGRDVPVEIVYFRPPRGLGAEIVRLYEELGILREPLAGLEGTFSGVEAAVEAAAGGECRPSPDAEDVEEEESATSTRVGREMAESGAVSSQGRRIAAATGRPGAGIAYGAVRGGRGMRRSFARVLEEARALRSRIREAAWHELHREPYRPSLAASILERVPADLEETTQEVVIAACEDFGFRVVPQRGEATYAIEFGSAARIDHLPGVPAGSNFLGTFEREEAIEKETVDFFASGHPLVEGILQEIEEGPRGRVALLQVRARGPRDGAGTRPGPPGSASSVASPAAGAAATLGGIVALYMEEGRIVPVILDEEGRERPELAEVLISRPLRSQRIKAEEWAADPDWSDRIRVLFARIGQRGRPLAVAAYRIVPPPAPAR